MLTGGERGQQQAGSKSRRKLAVAGMAEDMEPKAFLPRTSPSLA